MSRPSTEQVRAMEDRVADAMQNAYLAMIKKEVDQREDPLLILATFFSWAVTKQAVMTAGIYGDDRSACQAVMKSCKRMIDELFEDSFNSALKLLPEVEAAGATVQ